MEDVLFLLSKEELSSFDIFQLGWGKSWWLRSACSDSEPDSEFYAWAVDFEGEPYDLDISCSSGVRPAFKSEMIKDIKKVIQLGEFSGQKLYWILSFDKKFYLLKDYIFSAPFDDSDDNNYEKSSIKNIVKEIETAVLKDLKEE